VRARARYSKTGKLRFVSAIDLGRVWERSLRRADLPIAYSEGFSPHPKVSFPDALPLGYASTGEYVELTFTAAVDLDALVARLNEAFPPGIAVLAAATVDEGAPRLAKWLAASLWQVDYPLDCDPSELAGAVEQARAASELPVERERKGEITHEDLRPVLHEITNDDRTVRAVLHHTQPPLRPSEVHAALAGLAGSLPEPTLVTRVAQGQPADGGLIEALSGDLLPTARSAAQANRKRAS
jgi:radical SAM-linked protein